LHDAIGTFRMRVTSFGNVPSTSVGSDAGVAPPHRPPSATPRPRSKMATAKPPPTGVRVTCWDKNGKEVPGVISDPQWARIIKCLWAAKRVTAAKGIQSASKATSSSGSTFVEAETAESTTDASDAASTEGQEEEKDSHYPPEAESSDSPSDSELSESEGSTDGGSELEESRLEPGGTISSLKRSRDNRCFRCHIFLCSTRTSRLVLLVYY